MKSLILFVFILSGSLLFLRRAEARDARARFALEAFEDTQSASLLGRVEAGAAALEELGRLELAEEVRRVGEQLRADQEGTRQQRANDEVETVRRRLKVMRKAVEAFVRVEQIDKAELVERAMHAREMALERRRDAEAARIREEAPNRQELAQALRSAAEVYMKLGENEQAHALMQLAQTYQEQWDRRRAGSPEGPERLNDLGYRIEILGLAVAAYERAGHEQGVDYMRRFLRLAEMQRKGVTGAPLSEVAQGLTMEATIDHLNKASAILRDMGDMEGANLTRGLAGFYTARESARHEEIEEEEEPLDLTERSARMDVLRLAWRAHREAGHGDASEILERSLHLAELQDAGASDEDINAASQGLSMEAIIDCVQRAVPLYAEQGRPDRAELCERLVEFYRRRDGERADRDEVAEQSAQVELREYERKAREFERIEQEKKQAQFDRWRRSQTKEAEPKAPSHEAMREELMRLLDQTARLQDQLLEMRSSIERLVER